MWYGVDGMMCFSGWQMLERAAGSDVLWADALLSQACSLWYMILPAHLRSQWNKGEVLSQALDLLDTLSSSHALPNDEVSVISFHTTESV